MFLYAEQTARVAAADGGDGGAIELLDRGDMTDRVELRHVEGVIRPHDDVICAEHGNEVRELVRRKHNRIEIDFLQIARGRLGQIAMGIQRAPQA